MFGEKEYITDSDVSDEEPIEFDKSEPIVNGEGQENPLVAVIDKTHGEEPTKNLETRVRFCTWNVAGIRSNIKKGGFDFLTENQPDIISLQEIKCPDEKIPASAHIPGYYCYFEPGKKKGYAGVATFSKFKPIAVHRGIGEEEFDNEGRTLILEFPQCYIVNAYVPTSGEHLVTLDKRLRWNEKFKKFLCDLDYKKKVILAADLNVAHMKIDLAQPRQNVGKAAFTIDERDDLTNLLMYDVIGLLYDVAAR